MTTDTHPALVPYEMNRRPLTDAEGRGDRTPRESPGQHGSEMKTFNVTALRELITYDPETGNMFWNQRSEKWFQDGVYTAARRCKIWNTKFSGRNAFNSISAKGYAESTILGSRFKAHRVAWAIHYGTWPKGEIDHINGDRADNRIENLRDVSHAQNMKNTKLGSRNKSGVVGVFWRKDIRKWRAQIGSRDNRVFLGHFRKIADAEKARDAALKKYGFHENHGKASKIEDEINRAAAHGKE